MKRYCRGLFLLLFFGSSVRAQTTVTALFTAPDTVCVGNTFTVQNLSTGSISSHYWSFCMGNQNTTPTATNLGNFGSTFSGPVYYSIGKDGANYYAFVSNNFSGALTRLAYGGSLLNTPTVTILNIGLPSSLEDLHLQQESGSWYGLAVAGFPGSLYRLNFGSALSNTPTITNLGNIGGLNYPQRLQIFNSGGNWYGFTPNRNGNSITRFSFGASITNTPTGVNFSSASLGGVFSTPDDMAIIHFNNNWHAYVVNEGNNTVTRLDFGTSLTNTPTAINLGNTGALNGPRGIDVYVECDVVKGLIVNRYGNDLVKMNFPAGPTGTLITTSFGNIASFSFPHSIERFRVGDTLFAMIPNVNNNTLSRIYYPGCTNASIASSTLQIPPPISYNSPGTYYINLTLNEGLINQASYCRRIVAVPLPTLMLATSPATCQLGGSAVVTNVLGGPPPYTYTWFPSSQTGSMITGLAPGNYSVAAQNGWGCQADTVFPIGFVDPFSTTVSTSSVSCYGGINGTASVQTSGGSGVNTYTWTNGVNTFTNPVWTNLAAGIYSVSVLDTILGCTDSNTFQITEAAAFTVNISANSSTACVNQNITLTVNVSGGTPSYTTLWTAGPPGFTRTVSENSAGSHTYAVTVTDANNCVHTESTSLGFVALPLLTATGASICPGAQGTLTASGAASYTWQPANVTGNSFADSPPAPTIYTVNGEAANGCIASQTAAILIKSLPSLQFNSFSITCASLGSATVNATGLYGSASYTWLPVNQNGPVAGNLMPGTYTVLVLDHGSGCATDTNITFTSLIPLTGMVTSAASVACNGASTATGAVTNLAGGSGNEFYSWSNGQTTLTTKTVSTLGAGNWSVTVTDALTGCTVYSVLPISQPPALSVHITASSYTACLNDSVSFNAQVSGGIPGYSFLWQNAVSSQTYTVADTTPGQHIYAVTVVDTNNCVLTETVAVQYIPEPAIAVANAMICPGETGTLIATGATSFTWNNNVTGSTFTDAPSGGGPQPVAHIYTVTGSALGCTATTTASIIIKPLPNVIVSGTNNLCEGTQLTIFAGGGSGYKWAGPQGYNSNTQHVMINPAHPGHSGTYSVTVTSAGGCTATAGFSVQVHNTPQVSANDTTVCSGSPFRLQANTPDGVSYLWRGPVGYTSTVLTPSIQSATPGHAGIYSLVVTSAQGCTNIAVSTVSVAAPPSLSVSLSSSSLCAQALNGSPNTITLTSSGADTYTLITGKPITTESAAGTFSLSSTPPYLPTGIASATLIGSNGICTASMTTTFSIIPNPTITVSSNTPVICAGNSFTYTSAGASSYVWSASTPNFTTWNNGGIAVAHPSINSVFSVYGSSLGCRSALFTSTISVFPIPEFTINANSLAICKYNSTILQANGAATDFTWYPSFNLNSPTGASVTATPEADQTYTVIGSANGCTSSAVVAINVLDLPKPKARFTKNSVCLGDEVTLTGEGGKEYEWFGPAHLYYKGSPVTFSISNPAAIGDYTVIATDSNGCKGRATATITVHLPPGGKLKSDRWAGCVPFCSEFLFEPENDTDVISSWQLGTRKFAGNFTYCFTAAGKTEISGVLTNRKTGCRSTKTVVVNAYEKPRAGFEWTPQRPVADLDEVVFTSSAEASYPVSPSWFLAHNPGFYAEGDEFSLIFSEPGSYPVVQVVINEWGCADTIIKILDVDPEFQIYIPNAFTPNDDSKNESFKAVVRGVKKFHFQVFDRWGERLFVTEDPSEGWNGTYRSKICKNDSYVWKIVLTTYSGELKEYVGSVLLYR